MTVHCTAGKLTYISFLNMNQGLTLGLNAMQNSGNAQRDYRQEGEIRDTQNELERSKMREADMNARLRQMEMQQMQMQAK
jgi:hypothetical protein